MNTFQSWGFFPKAAQELVEYNWTDQELPRRSEHPLILPHGLGRSYGDVCLNDGGTLLATARLNRIIDFDSTTGRIRCEAGLTLKDILDFAVPRGWFLPVTPGTKYVTVGGAIANDVHGKNHHRAGTFGRHVQRFELLRSNGERWVCSPSGRPEYYRASIGGLGLTGLILWADLQLRKINGPFINAENLKFGSLGEFFAISTESDRGYEYTVAWLDCVSAGSGFGRGIFMRGNHSERFAAPAELRVRRELLSVPVFLPSWTLNPWTVRAFNYCYYHKQTQPLTKMCSHYDPFFYPLDVVRDWNRIYGRRGFLQFQCVVPDSSGHHEIGEILKVIVDSGRASFLAVLKEFGGIESPGLLSFPKKGVTLCLDFPNEGPKTWQLFERLEKMVLERSGRLYPAKDALMQPETFKSCYPRWQEFKSYIDPRFSSSFWRRVTRS